jgi:hypothetical protein
MRSRASQYRFPFCFESASNESPDSSNSGSAFSGLPTDLSYPGAEWSASVCVCLPAINIRAATPRCFSQQPTADPARRLPSVKSSLCGFLPGHSERSARFVMRSQQIGAGYSGMVRRTGIFFSAARRPRKRPHQRRSPTSGSASSQSRSTNEPIPDAKDGWHRPEIGGSDPANTA